MHEKLSTGPLSPGARTWVETNHAAYRDLATRHASGVEQVG